MDHRVCVRHPPILAREHLQLTLTSLYSLRHWVCKAWMWTWTAFLLVRLPVILRELFRKFCQLRELMFNTYMILLRWEFSVHLTRNYHKSSFKSPSLISPPFSGKESQPPSFKTSFPSLYYYSLTNDRLYWLSIMSVRSLLWL